MVQQIGNSEKEDLYRSGYLSAYIEVTDRCNQRCRHCFANYSPENVKKCTKIDPPFINFKKIIKNTEAYRDQELFYELSGGEILLRPDWEEICRLFLNTGKNVYMFTNATLVDKETAIKIKNLDLDFPEKFKVNCSLDSHIASLHNTTRGMYEETLNGLRLLREYQVPIKINVTPSQYNYSTIEQTFDFISKNLTKEIVLGVLRPVFSINDRTKKLFLPYEDLIYISRQLTEKATRENWKFYSTFHPDGKAYCEAGMNHLLIDTSGDVTPCYSLRQKQYVMGNILSNSLENIMNKIKIFNSGRNTRILLCEHLEEIFGVPPYKMESLS